MNKELLKENVEHAFNSSYSSINLSNRGKVFFERLALFQFRDYFQSKYSNLDIFYNLPNSNDYFKRNSSVRELFPVNYSQINNHFINIIPVHTRKSEYLIPRRIFDSNIHAEHYVFIYINEKKNEFEILGFTEYQEIEDTRLIFDPDMYIIFNLNQNIDDLFERLQKPKEVRSNIDNSNIININNKKIEKNIIDMLYKRSNLDNFKYYINDLSDEDYYLLLTNEKLCTSFIELQNLYLDSEYEPQYTEDLFNKSMISKLFLYSPIANKLSTHRAGGIENLLYIHNIEENNIEENKTIKFRFININEPIKLDGTILKTKLFFNDKNYYSKKASLFFDISNKALNVKNIFRLAESMNNKVEEEFSKDEVNFIELSIQGDILFITGEINENGILVIEEEMSNDIDINVIKNSNLYISIEV
ncbi:MAG: DUF1822 family protein [Cyanobacteriota bacterium]